MGKVHHQIRLRILTQQSERKPSRTRSPRGKSPSGRTSRWPCKDLCLFYKTKNGCRFGKSAHSHIVKLMNSPAQRSKKNDGKSAVAMMNNGNWQESVQELVINYVKSHDRSRRPDEKRDCELKRGPTGRPSSNARQLGRSFSRHEAAEVDFTEELKHAEANPTCQIHEGCCTSH